MRYGWCGRCDDHQDEMCELLSKMSMMMEEAHGDEVERMGLSCQVNWLHVVVAACRGAC